MKKVVLAIAVLVMALFWNQLAAGQAGANTPGQTTAASLDDQMFQAIEKGISRRSCNCWNKAPISMPRAKTALRR
jgi:hypothetical protein